MKEAAARIKINKLLEAAGWRFFDEGGLRANIRLESSVAIKIADLNALGENFEKTTRGFVDFLLVDAKSFPLIALEAKAEDKNPLVGKEQARKYARSQNCRFVTCLKPRGRTPRRPAAGAPPWRSPSFLDLRAIPPVFSGRGCRCRQALPGQK